MDCLESNFFPFFTTMKTPSHFTRSRTIEKFEKFNLVAISRVVCCSSSFTSIDIFVSSSTGLTEHGVSLTSKLSERNFKKHFSHWRTVHRFDVTFFLPEQHFYLFHNKKVKYAENTPFDLAYLSSPAKNTQSNEFFLQMNHEMPKYIMAALFRMKLAA